MKNALKVYINKLLSYIPVAVFIYTILILINISQNVENLKAEFGINAIDEFINIYIFYLIRTIILTLLLPLLDHLVSIMKLSYKKSIIIHGVLINIAVGMVYYQPGIEFETMLLVLGTGIIIYIVVWAIIYVREKQFLNDANEIFKENSQK
jgi:hypothetical protein